jgi:hypothetical protein
VPFNFTCFGSNGLVRYITCYVPIHLDILALYFYAIAAVFLPYVDTLFY